MLHFWPPMAHSFLLTALPQCHLTICRRKRQCSGSRTCPSGTAFAESERHSDVVAEGRLLPHSRDVGPWAIGLIVLCLLTEPRRDGAFIVVKDAADVPYGTVRLVDSITSFSVGGENGQFIRRPQNGSFKLPVGTYRIDYWNIIKDDGKGSKWELRGRGGSSSAFTVTQDKEARLAAGEPVYSMVSYNQSSGSFTFSQRLQGRQNEQITLLRNGSQPQPPKLRIRNKDGTYDRGMSFEWG